MSALFVFAWTALCGAAPPSGVHTALERLEPKRLEGLTLETLDNGFSSYALGPKGSVQYRGIMGASGTGTWALSKTGLRAQGTAKGGPCDGDESCDKSWSWSVEFSDAWMSESGLLVLHRASGDGQDERIMLQCKKEKVCEMVEAILVEVIPGSVDRRLYELTIATLIASKLARVFVEGAPAKAPREGSEVWWVAPEREVDAKAISLELTLTLGPTQAMKWTFSKPPYEVIVVVGKSENRAAEPAVTKSSPTKP